jgi:hypothetical protein
MRRNIGNSNNFNVTGRLFGLLAVEKKKTVTTACLIVVMVFMWVRVLTRNTPEAAEGASVAEPLNVKSQSNPAAEVFFVELPRVAGRNDVITRDFFASDGWRHFMGGRRRKFAGIEEVNVLSKNGSEEVIKRVAQKLKLEGIMLSKNPLASINNRVVLVGDRMLIADGADMYECEVRAIKENAVEIKCREAEITLKLVPVSMVGN